MKQTEFEQQLRDMRMQKSQEIAAIAQLQSQVNKERALLNTQYDDLRKRIHTLDIERVSLSQRRMDVEAKWGGQIRKFYQENYTASRELEEVSDWALVNELAHRGFGGLLSHPDRDADFMMKLNEKMVSHAPESED